MVSQDMWVTVAMGTGRPHHCSAGVQSIEIWESWDVGMGILGYHVVFL